MAKQKLSRSYLGDEGKSLQVPLSITQQGWIGGLIKSLGDNTLSCHNYVKWQSSLLVHTELSFKKTDANQRQNLCLDVTDDNWRFRGTAHYLLTFQNT